eukprot:scaffold148_cov371-Prasinococcus_capsulatus_cf.AAC.12
MYRIRAASYAAVTSVRYRQSDLGVYARALRLHETHLSVAFRGQLAHTVRDVCATPLTPYWRPRRPPRPSIGRRGASMLAGDEKKRRRRRMRSVDAPRGQAPWGLKAQVPQLSSVGCGHRCAARMRLASQLRRTVYLRTGGWGGTPASSTEGSSGGVPSSGAQVAALPGGAAAQTTGRAALETHAPATCTIEAQMPVPRLG